MSWKNIRKEFWMDVYDLKYEQFQEYVLTGKSGSDMPKELVEFLDLLEIARGVYQRSQSSRPVITLLTTPVYGLSQYQAEGIFNKMVNTFYVNKDIKKDAYRNLYCELLLNDYKLAWKKNDPETCSRIVMRMAEVRQLNLPDPIELPQGALEKKTNVYVLDPSFFGMPDDTRELAAFIDKLDVPEKQKLLAKRDARISDAAFTIWEDIVEDED